MIGFVFVKPGSPVNLSVVLPVFNEEESLESTLSELVAVLQGGSQSWEIVVVDDGSQDGSARLLTELHKRNPKLKVISFRSNFGQTAAMAAGIDFAVGDVIVTMDADGQNDPQEIRRLLNEIYNGFDVVVGWRKARKDSLMRVLPSRIANWIISRTTGVALHDYGCSLKAFKAEAIKEVVLIGEMHRMIPVLVRRNGCSIKEVVVNHRERLAGSSKYSLSRTPRVVADLIVARFLLLSSVNPMYYFGKFALGGLALAVVSLSSSVYFKVAGLKDFVETPLPLISLFSVMFASLALLAGLLAELLVRVHFQQGQKPYRVRWTLGL